MSLFVKLFIMEGTKVLKDESFTCKRDKIRKTFINANSCEAIALKQYMSVWFLVHSCALL